MAPIRPEVEVWVKRLDSPTGRSYGTGMLVGGQLVLTASHVVISPDSTDTVSIRTQSGEEIYEGKVIWSNQDEGYRAALVEIIDTTWPRDARVAPARFGQVAGEGVLNCQIVGFPRFALRNAGDYAYRDTAQVVGVISPLANAKSGYLSINVTSAPPRPDSNYGSPSPWAGMSGAPVQCQGCTVGMVFSARPDNSLEAVRIEKLAHDRRFVELIEKAIGRKLTFETIEHTDSFGDTVNSVIESVAAADASNTQQIAALELALSKAYYERVLSQARSSFTSALISAGIGLLFFLAAISVALVSGLISAALISTISGAIVEVISGLNFWLYSRTAAQLDAFHQRLEQTQRFLLANSVATNVQDLQQKDKVVADLVATIAGSVIGAKPRSSVSAAKPRAASSRQSRKAIDNIKTPEE